MRIIAFLLALISLSCVSSYAQNVDPDNIQPSPLFSDHMVIQRGQQMIVWGTGTPDAKVLVEFQGDSKITKVSDYGRWEMLLKEPQVGGPFELSIDYKTIKDVYVGDVWMAGGQSNMEWPMRSVNDSQQEINALEYPLIRFFRTPKVMHNKEQPDLTGGEWKTMNATELPDMSAVAYFFAKRIHSELNIPIGIVDHSWGGSDIEGWLPYEAFSDFPGWQKKAEDFQNIDYDPVAEQENREKWFMELDRADKGLSGKWYDNNPVWTSAANFEIPATWEQNGYPNKDGVFWFQRSFTMSDLPRNECMLSLGKIDDSDQTYINGKLIGDMENAYNKDRFYKVNSIDLQVQNSITVRVRDNGGAGGFSSEAKALFLECDGKKIELSGAWKIKEGSEGYPAQPNIITLNNLPANRYNAMMKPLFRFPMTGMIWYQGESNTRRPTTYSAHFHEMIEVYRNQWGRDFPFLFVQLANFMPVKEPGNSDWAELREAQASVLDLPFTAMASAIDIGQADDIHPRNKKDVGNRLANAALAIEYKMDIPYKNPTLKSAIRKGKKIELEFDNIGKSLLSGRAEELPTFFAQDETGAFFTVKAALLGNKVLVSDKKKLIKTLYYAWADNPGNLALFNSNGLPVLPFRVRIEE